MKFNGYVCDRCGANYTKNTTRDGDKLYVGVGILDLKNHVKRFDLCDNCLTLVIKYLTETNPQREVRSD